jgi:integrase
MAKRKATRRKLTEMTRQRATAGERRKLIWDTIQRGLALAVEPTGRQSWKFVYRWPPGAKGSKPVWLTWHGLGLADARERAQAMWKLIHDGVDPRGGRQASLQETMTFDQLHRRYVDQWSRKENRQWREIERLVSKHLVPEFGAVPAAQVSRADVRDAINKIRKAGRDSLANRVLGHAGGVYRWAIKEGIVEIASNPTEGLGRTKGKPKDRWLAESELKAFWPESFDHGAAGAALRAMALTGQRGNEIRRYSPAHVEDKVWWNIPAGIYKNKKSHRVFLTADAIEALAAVDWGNAASIDQREALMRKAASAITKKLKQKPWTPHSLRHTVISHLARMGVHKEVRARVVGHSEGGGVQSDYTHHGFDPEKRQVMNRWAAELRRIREGRPAEGDVVQIRA